MRIGFVIGSYLMPSETFISRKVEFLLQQGHDVVIFQLHPRSNNRQNGRTGLTIVNLRRNGHTLLRGIRSVLKDAFLDPVRVSRICARTRTTRYPGAGRLDRLLRYLQIARHHVDVLHVHFAGNLIPIIGVKDIVGVPVVVSLLGSDVTSADHARIHDYLKLIPPESDKLIAACEYLRNEFCRRTQTQEEIRILPPEVPWRLFDCERQYKEAPCRLLTVARLHWKKGLLYALHAAHELKRRGVVFSYDIIGDGEERESLEKAIGDLELTDVVHLLGAKDPEEVPEYYRKADIFILPSVNEGAGGVLMEAQAAGLPIVASRVGGIPDGVQEGETALLVTPRNPLALADAIEKLTCNVLLRQELGRNGGRNGQRYDTENVGAQLVDVYISAVQNAARRESEDKMSVMK